MPQFINTNISSLNSQRALGKSQDALATALQRLSSGLRINSAKDDAAGLAISERMTSQIRGFNQAARNANDGISLAQTAEGSLAEVNNNLQRIRELALQSANATNSSSDRAALDLEVQQLITEVERVASTTSFNNVRLLDGSFTAQSFQVGADANQTIDVTITGSRTSQMGAIATDSGVVDSNAITGQVTINSTTVADSVAGSANGQDANSAYAKAIAINGSGLSDVAATATSAVFTTTTNATGGATDDIVFNDQTTDQTYELTINTVAIYNTTLVTQTGLDNEVMAAQINLNSGATGVTASFSGDTLTLSSIDGRNINIAQDSDDVKVESVLTSSFASLAVNIGNLEDFTTFGSVELTSGSAIAVTGNAVIGVGTTIALDSGNLASVDVTTADNAQAAIARVDTALARISTSRAELGAIQNRMSSTIASVQTISENLSAARSRIQDADFAAETAALTRAQILQQAGTAMLAQANATPQNALSLLQ